MTRPVVNDVLEKIYQTGCVADATGNLRQAFPVSVSRDVGEFIAGLILRNKLHRTLEIGLGYGLSTLFICQAHADLGQGRHTAIDPFQTSEFASIGLLNIRRASLESTLQFYEAPSYEVLPKLVMEKEQFDLAFVDGNHLFDYTLVDFFYIDKLLRLGGYVAFHDLWMPSVRKAISFALRNREYKLFFVSVTKGWRTRMVRVARRLRWAPFEMDYAGLRLIGEHFCVLIKTGDDHRPWNFHVAF